MNSITILFHPWGLIRSHEKLDWFIFFWIIFRKNGNLSEMSCFLLFLICSSKKVKFYALALNIVFNLFLFFQIAMRITMKPIKMEFIALKMRHQPQLVDLWRYLLYKHEFSFYQIRPECRIQQRTNLRFTNIGVNSQLFPCFWSS